MAEAFLLLTYTASTIIWSSAFLAALLNPLLAQRPSRAEYLVIGQLWLIGQVSLAWGFLEVFEWVQ